MVPSDCVCMYVYVSIIIFKNFLQGEVQALFLRHEGYLGTIGAFLKGAEEDSKSMFSSMEFLHDR